MRDGGAPKIDHPGHRRGGIEACAHALKTNDVLTTYNNDFAQAAMQLPCWVHSTATACSLSVAGVGLLEENKIRVQMACGGVAVQISTDNLLGAA